jgi:predicted dehydrogenase
MSKPVNIGIIGVGNIFPQYIKGCRQYPVLNVAAIADIHHEAAVARGAEYSVSVKTVDELLADPSIELIVNLTVPAVHQQVDLEILSRGKHVYSEKPLALNRKGGKEVMDAADKAGLLVGCAPDTFLGGGIQTSLKLISDGWIGAPIAATAFMAGHGPESWHPNPGFYYLQGGGPMYDMGPYYLTALIALLGSIDGVSAVTGKSFQERIATSPARSGQRLPVEVNTHVSGNLKFTSGAIGTIITSFDVWGHHLPRVEIHGTHGSLSVPDPNTFGGPVRLWLPYEREWRDMPLTHNTEIGRGTGVADMAIAIQTGRRHRASGALAYHVLDAMDAFDESSEQGKYIPLTSQLDRPTPLPMGLMLGQID